MRRVDIVTVVPDVGDDHAAVGTGKIDADAASGIISRVDSYGDGVGSGLAGCRIGRLTGSHGHDLLAHDHETVIKNAHHHDEEDGQDEGELDKGLTLTSASADSKLLEIREGFHGSLV
jgi:hypothetical protein